MVKASDNEFPSLLVKEGTAPSSPASGDQRVYIDSSDHKLKRKNSSGTVTPIEGCGTTSPLTTKGDIWGYSSTDARLPVGSDTQVLTADSSQTLGIKWAAAGSGGALTAHPLPLDSYTIDGTYGDDFTAGSLSGSWTRRNFTSGAETYQVGPQATAIRIAMASRAAGDGYFRTAPAGDWTFGMGFTLLSTSLAAHWGLMVVDTNGTGVGFAIYHSGPTAPLMQGVTTYTTTSGNYYEPLFGSTASPNIGLLGLSQVAFRKTWFYLRKSSTNYYVSFSQDGETWAPEGGPLAWAGTVDRVGMGLVALASTSVTTSEVVHVDWFNKIA